MFKQSIFNLWTKNIFGWKNWIEDVYMIKYWIKLIKTWDGYYSNISNNTRKKDSNKLMSLQSFKRKNPKNQYSLLKIMSEVFHIV